MKLIRKILPLTALTAVATVPVVATSCSNTWTDVLTNQYIPQNYTPLAAQDITQDDIDTSIFDYYLENPNHITEDFYWSSSTYAREMLPENINGEVQTYLSHLYYFNIDKTTHRTSYKFSCQIQDKIKNEEATSKTSYSINTYDITWELKNIEFVPAYTGNGSEYPGYAQNFKFWSLVPDKFDMRRGIWYEELEGDEQIIFNFKTVSKGYSESGAQNFVRETNESAIIDETHKYAPQLSELYTAAMLFDSYFLINCTPRASLDTMYYYGKWASSTISAPIDLTLGSQTTTDYNDQKLTFSFIEDETLVESETDFKVKNIEVDDITIASGTTKLTPTMKITKDPSTSDPNRGDKIHTTLVVNCPAVGTHKKWEERLYLTFYIV